MSHLSNIRRDGLWTQTDGNGKEDWSTSFILGVGNPLFNNDLNVYDSEASVQSDRSSSTITAGECAAIGVLMRNYNLDTVPLRVKASVNYGGYIIVGYAPASPTGNDDAINDSVWIPFVYKCDEIIMVPVTSNHTTDSIAVALAVQPPSGLSAGNLPGHLSVQNMAIKEPTIAAAMS